VSQQATGERGGALLSFSETILYPGQRPFRVLLSDDALPSRPGVRDFCGSDDLGIMRHFKFGILAAVVIGRQPMFAFRNLRVTVTPLFQKPFFAKARF
jgi:hypothetical protein